MLYFQADDGISGAELWRTDGTDAGTVLVKDLLPGSRGSAPKYMTVFKNKLYFQANGVDTTWILTNTGGDVGNRFHPFDVDACNGLRQSSFDSSVIFAVSNATVWEKSRVYDCPNGYHWASTAEAMKLFPSTHGGASAGP